MGAGNHPSGAFLGQHPGKGSAQPCVLFGAILLPLSAEGPSGSHSVCPSALKPAGPGQRCSAVVALTGRAATGWYLRVAPMRVTESPCPSQTYEEGLWFYPK